jgi:predicted cupin superfamily sugar epimerase
MHPRAAELIAALDLRPQLSASAQSVLRHRLGPVGSGTDAPVCTIGAGIWQAARPLGQYAFLGCTVGPGFDFADFRLLADDHPRAAAVRAAFPDLAVLI